MTDTSSTVSPTATSLDPSVQTFLYAHPEYAWMVTDPELGPILDKAVVQGWDANAWQAAIEHTRWFATHGEAARAWAMLAGADPAEADSRVQAEMQQLQADTSTLGISLSDAQLHALAYQALQFGWTPQETQNHIGKTVTYQNGQFQVQPFYVDPTTGQEVDAFTGRRAYYGPNGEPATPTAPTDMTGWASFVQQDGTTVYYHQGGTAANYQTKVNGQYVDTRTGRPAFYGPTGEPGTPDAALAAQTWGAGGFQTFTRDDGVTIYYKAGTGATSTGQGTASTVPGGGLLGSTKDTLKATASQYLVPISDTALSQWTLKIVTGQADAKGFEAYMKEQAKSMFPAMAAAIDAGITPMQYVDPYKQIASRLLGVGPDTIDMSQPQYMRAVGQKDPKTGMPVAMSLWDWEKTVMQDPTYGYQKTQNATDRASALAGALGTMFGQNPGGGTGIAGAAPLTV